MPTNMLARIKLWWWSYRKWILALAVIYLIVILALAFMTTSPQTLPFIYQLF